MSTTFSAASDSATGALEYASDLGHILRTSADAEARSAAAGLLADAGRAAPYAEEAAWGIVEHGAPAVTFGVSLATSLVNSDPITDAIERAGYITVGSIIGATLGAAIGATETIATSGFGAVAVPALVAGGGIAGGVVGEKVGNFAISAQHAIGSLFHR